MYSKIIIIGNLGRDPELKFTADGKAVANFSVATSRKYKDTDETNMFHWKALRSCVWLLIVE